MKKIILFLFLLISFCINAQKLEKNENLNDSIRTLESSFENYENDSNGINFRADCPVTPIECDLILNGGFEINNGLPNLYAQFGARVCQWESVDGSCDYYHVNSASVSTDIPSPFVNMNTTTTPNGGNAYAGFIFSKPEAPLFNNGEVMATTLTNPLLANTNYTLTFNVARVNHTAFKSGRPTIQAYLSSTILPANFSNPANYINGNLNLGIDPTGILINDDNELTNFNVWDEFSITFNSGVGGQEFLYIGSISNAGFTLTAATNNGQYCIVDNVSLKIQNPTPQLNLPDTPVCSNIGTLILNNYLTNGVLEGVFSGTGVVYESGEYVFDPSLAGVGIHTITYTIPSPFTCPEVIVTDTIEVINCMPTHPPYISQVFKTIGKDRFVEIKNADNTIAITPGMYYLAFYQDSTLLTGAPTYSIPLGNIPANGVDLFKSIPTIVPAYALAIATDFPNLQQFDGENDIMIITTTNDATAYANRVDEIGDFSGSSIFYKDYTQEEYKSLVRVSCMPLNRLAPQIIYDEQDWVGFNKIYDYADDTEVFTQTAKTNDVLGRHYKDELRWIGSWDDTGITDPANESTPDRSRSVVITQPYVTSVNGSFEACSLVSDQTLTINSLNNVKVQTKVTSTPPFNGIVVQNQGSLIQVRDAFYGLQNQQLIQVNGQNSMKHSRETVGLNRGTDYVYWSSPLSLNAINKKAGQIFGFGSAIGQFNPSRFYRFENQNFYDMVNTYGNNGSGTDGYDDNLNDYMPFSSIPAAINEHFIPGRGYATWPPISSSGLFTNYVANYTVTFEGEMNNGEVTVPVYRNDSQYGTDSNLIGNPYPSPIDLDKFLYDPINSALIRPVAFIWGRFVDDTPLTTNPGPELLDYIEDNFKIYNPDMDIDPTQAPYSGNEFIFNSTLASCQSFFVLAKDPNNGGNPIYNTGLIETLGNIRFSNYMRTTKPNNTFSRTSSFNQATNRNNTSSSDKLWVNLADANGYTVQLGLTFKEDGSATYNQDEDIETVHGRKYNFYTQTTSKDLIIDVQDEFNTSKEIPLGILNNNSVPNQILTISIARKSGVFNTQSVYLYDAETATSHNITNGSYSFTTNQVINEGRFKLIFEPITSSPSSRQSSDIICSFNQNGLTLTSFTSEIESFEVYDLEVPKSTGYLIALQKNVVSKLILLPLEGKHRLISVKIKLKDGTQVAKKLAR